MEKGKNDKIVVLTLQGVDLWRGIIEENDVGTYKHILPEVCFESSRDGSEKAILVDNIS